MLTRMDALTHHRSHKDEFFRESPHSPLPDDARHGFSGLRYFEPNPTLVLQLPVDNDVAGEIEVQTSDGLERLYRRAGRVRFEIDGEPATRSRFSESFTAAGFRADYKGLVLERSEALAKS